MDPKLIIEIGRLILEIIKLKNPKKAVKMGENILKTEIKKILQSKLGEGSELSVEGYFKIVKKNHEIEKVYHLSGLEIVCVRMKTD